MEIRLSKLNREFTLTIYFLHSIYFLAYFLSCVPGNGRYLARSFTLLCVYSEPS